VHNHDEASVPNDDHDPPDHDYNEAVPHDDHYSPDHDYY
jgi:hypothetical protein